MGLFRFKPENVITRKKSNCGINELPPTKINKNLDRIKEDAPYKHSSERSIPSFKHKKKPKGSHFDFESSLENDSFNSPDVTIKRGNNSLYESSFSSKEIGA